MTESPPELRSRLVGQLEDQDARVLELEVDLNRVHEASEDSNADDEHDPEGATIAFERQQLVTVLSAARRTREELRSALSRLDAGVYGRCESCGRPIAPARLAARPQATTCLDCAGRAHS